MSMMQALLMIIDRPQEAMRRVAERPRYWLLAAALLVLGLVLLTALSAPQQIAQANERTQAMIEQLKATMSEEQARVLEGRDMNMTPGRFWLTAVGLGVLMMALGWLFRGVVVHFSSMGVGGVSDWGPTFAVCVWSMLPFFVRDVLQAIYIGASKQLIEHQGIAFLVSSGDWLRDSQDLAYAALSNVDLFALWHIVLLGIGISVATKVSRSKGTVLAVIVWAVFLGLKLIPVAISKAFGGGLLG